VHDLEPLTAAQRARLRSVLDIWAVEHPSPDRPLIGFGGTRILSPLSLAASVADRDEDGQAFERIVRMGMDVVSFDEIVAQFREDTGK